MPRYRCPQCSQVLNAHDLRAGKKSVCTACLASHVIPADRAEWLDEAGRPLAARPQPDPEPAPQVFPPAPPAVPATPAPANPPVPEPVLAGEPAPARAELSPEPGPSARPIVRRDAPTPLPIPRPPARRALVSSEPEPAGPAVAEVEATPVNARTQADIAAALTEVLTRRMKPRRKPPRDLHPSTAVWLFLTAVAAALVFATLFTPANLLPWVFVIAGVQALLGYAWILSLTAGRDAKRGLACAVPPVTLYYLSQRKYAKFRPLRFVATGVLIAATAVVAQRVAWRTRAWVGTPPQAAQARPPDATGQSKLDQLRSYRERKAYDKLIGLLRELNTTDAVISVDAGDRAELATEIRVLCGHPDNGVKVAAMAAYVRWGGEDARDICLAALDPSRTEDETVRALELLPKWKDTPAAPRIARNVAALIGPAGRVTTKATVALEEIGGPAAETAALDLLGRAGRSDDRTTKLIALNVLGKVGGEEAAAALARYANTSIDHAVRTKALETAEAIRLRLKK